jgi:hypothetical protein
MRADKSKGKGQAKGKKLAVKKAVVKDLEPQRGVKAGAKRTSEWMRHAANHNETLTRDRAAKRGSR